MEVDWDLGAVVRSCCRGSGSSNNSASSTSSVAAAPSEMACFSSLLGSDFLEKDSFLSTPPDLFQQLNELEQLYKPFVTNYQEPQRNQQVLVLQQQQQQQPISPISPMPNSSLTNLSNPTTLQSHCSAQLPQLSRRTISGSGSAIAPRPKRRKNQQKKVVCQVPAEGITSDVWAWRKYGQKPIKGSPYPRGYYRCSSSKGCLARKQVERSRTDPGMFIVTYTAEHNHPAPTHRNSLAGSTRLKISTPQTPQTPPLTSTIISKPPTSSNSPLGLSPTTPLTSSMEDEDSKNESGGDDDNNNIDYGLSQLEEGLMSDDLFMELERQGSGVEVAASPALLFDECFTNNNNHTLWFNTTTTAASATAAGSV